MTPEQIEAARLAEESKIQAELENDPIAKLQAENAKLSEERDNYRNVALKRLGKLPGDKEFIEGRPDENELSVTEQVRIELLNREIEKTKATERAEVERMRRENAELKLALKNKTGSSLGGDSGSSAQVRDNIFSESQLEALRARALRVKADPEAFIQKAKDNLARRA